MVIGRVFVLGNDRGVMALSNIIIKNAIS